MTSHGILELSNYLVTSFLQLNIGQGDGHYTRVGAVGYGDNATLQHSLTSFTSVNDLLSRFNPTIDGTKGSNIEAAIRLAQDQFDSQGHRPNVKRVIILAASHYEPGTSEDPTQVAQQFREDGGFLITLEYVQEHGAQVPILADLASPCFAISNSNADLHAVDLQNKLCMANCFCLTNWEPYMINPTCNVPDGGCYYPVLIPAAEILAKAFCERQTGGMLVKVEDAAKAIFVNSMYSNTKEKTWIGLEYSPLKFGYVWDDGSNVGSYQPFASRNISVTCVSQQPGSGFLTNWYPADCVEDHMYTCQSTPCSADKYCP
ncbi:unnamed protein product, partial [Mesorhabditis belari]|uniref:VWFA domain-containing protein n=1 Tax=Mesorhabditis belari TaxID=2138241 RepID=A0AAF3EAJ5_9BILA